MVGAVMISNPASNQQRNNQHRPDAPKRQFTRINMTLSQVLSHLLKSNLVTLKEAPKNPNIASPRYNLNAWCAYHSETLGHDTNDCWALKNKLQELIDAKEVEFDPPETPNVITAPMPKHGPGVIAIDVVSATEDADSSYDLDKWIFSTISGGLSNWEAKDFVPISFIQE